MPVYVVTIAGVEKTIREGSLVINATSNARATLTCTVVSADGTYRPALGAEILVTEDAVRIFGGHLDTPTEHGLADAGTVAIETDLSAVDFNALADRRSVTASIVAGTLKAALQVLDDYLTPYGVTLDAAQVDGPALPALDYDDRLLTEVFNELTALSGYVWEIDFSKVLRMYAPGSVAAPVNIVDGDRRALGDVTVEPTRADYANRVIVKAGSGTQDVEDDFTGDGATTAFVLTYEVAGHRGYVTNAGTNETLGETGSGATWIHTTSGDVTTITRTSAPANGAAINIVYTAQYPYRAQADDAAAQAAVGLWEKVIAASDVFDATVAEALAEAYLDRAVETPKVVRYVTRETGLKPGQTQTITIARRNLNGTYFITDVETRAVAGTHLLRTVTAIEGTLARGSWRDTYKAWASGGGSSVGSGAVLGSGGIGGAGTAGKIPKFGTATSLADSLISESGSTVTVAGLLSATGFGAHAFSSGGTGAQSLSIRNTTAGTGNFARLRIGTDVGADRTFLDAYSSTFSPTNADHAANGSLLFAQGAGGLALTAADASGNIRFFTNGTRTVARATLDSTAFAPGTTRVLGLGTDANKFLTLYAEELNVQTLVAREVIATIGGQILVGQTTTLVLGISDASTTLTFKHNEIDKNDTLALKKAGQVEYIRVFTDSWGGIAGVDATANWFEIVGDWTATYVNGFVFVIRGSSGNNGSWTVSTSTFDGGTSRTRITVTGDVTSGVADGYIAYHVNSGGFQYPITRNVDGSGGNSWSAGDAVFNTGTTGDGFIDLYSFSGLKAGTEIGPTIVGNVRNSTTWNDWSPRWAIGNLNGLYGYAADTYGVALGVPTAAHILIDPTNGIRIRHNATNKITLDASGNASFSGSITATAGTIGGWTIGASSLTGGNATLASSGNLTLGTGNDVVRLSADDGTYRFWIGNATAASASFRVTKAGALTATGATISGAITATSGSFTGNVSVTGAGEFEAGDVILNSSGLSVAAGANIAFGAAGTIGYVAIPGQLKYDAASEHSFRISGTEKFLIQSGEISIFTTLRATALGADTGTALVLNASDRVKTDSSSIRYKERIHQWRSGASAILAAEPIVFDYIGGTKDVLGFSAEQLHEHDPRLVNLDADGRPDSIRIQAFLAHLVVALQAQQRQIDALEARSQR